LASWKTYKYRSSCRDSLDLERENENEDEIIGSSPLKAHFTSFISYSILFFIFTLYSLGSGETASPVDSQAWHFGKHCVWAVVLKV
jgi:hypothetical protein